MRVLSVLGVPYPSPLAVNELQDAFFHAPRRVAISAPLFDHAFQCPYQDAGREKLGGMPHAFQGHSRARGLAAAEAKLKDQLGTGRIVHPDLARQSLATSKQMRHGQQKKFWRF
jgi:hypothetical protein